MHSTTADISDANERTKVLNSNTLDIDMGLQPQPCELLHLSGPITINQRICTVQLRYHKTHDVCVQYRHSRLSLRSVIYIP